MTSKDDSLGDHLAAIGAATIVLTFAEVEAVLGPLPQVARRQGKRWGHTPAARYHHVHAMHRWRAGYVADQPDLAAGTVTFRRVVP
ncbi:MAG TPA: hypothetical protein VIC60_08955 [Thermomicrobiales bacterium]|jgi:hypothetical protein